MPDSFSAAGTWALLPRDLVRRTTQRIRWATRSTLGQYTPYLHWVRHRHPDKTVGPSTQLIIEGFPRSGNTFAETAFRMAQPFRVPIAHHLHIPAQVIAGVQQGIPSLVLIRPPDDAVLSFVIKTGGGISLAAALRYYIRFYAPLLPYRHRVVWARFEDVVTDFGAVIQQVNTQYGTDFTPFEHTEANVKRSFDRIERKFSHPTQPFHENNVGRPSTARQQTKARLQHALQASSLTALRATAHQLYETLVPVDRSPRSSDSLALASMP